MATALEPEVVEEVAQSPSDEKPVKKRRAQVRYKIRHLPVEVRRELDRRLGEQDFYSFEQLSDWLEREHGQEISPESLHNYFRNKFDPMLKAVKFAALQSAEILRVTGGDDDLNMSAALFRLVQTAIFDLLVQVNTARQLVARIPDAERQSQSVLKAHAEHGGDDQPQVDAAATAAALVAKYSNKVELAAVTALGRTTAIVSKAVIDLQRWREEIREKLSETIATATAKISATAREGGMSAETEDTIRALLMEIKL